MSRDGDDFSVNTFEFAGSSMLPNQSQKNKVTVVLENDRLKKENEDLWLCLKLMRDNSELECANLISSVIAWCDDKFKRRFLELNSAIKRQRLTPSSPFRPITPAQSPASDISDGLHSQFYPTVLVNNPNASSTSGSRQQFSPHNFPTTSGVIQKPGLIYKSNQYSSQNSVQDGRLHVTSQNMSQSGHMEQFRAVSPTQGSVYGSFMEPSRSIVEGFNTHVSSSSARRSLSPTQGSVYETFDTYPNFPQANKSELHNRSADVLMPSLPPTPASFYYQQQEINRVSPLSARSPSPLHRSTYSMNDSVSPHSIPPNLPERSLPPTPASFYHQQQEIHRVSPVSTRSPSPIHRRTYSMNDSVSPHSISPNLPERSVMMPGSLPPTPASFYEQYQETNRVSPRSNRRSPSPISISSISNELQLSSPKSSSPFTVMRSLPPTPAGAYVQYPNINRVSPVSAGRSPSPIQRGVNNGNYYPDVSVSNELLLLQHINGYPVDMMRSLPPTPASFYNQSVETTYPSSSPLPSKTHEAFNINGAISPNRLSSISSTANEMLSPKEALSNAIMRSLPPTPASFYDQYPDDLQQTSGNVSPYRGVSPINYSQNLKEFAQPYHRSFSPTQGSVYGMEQQGSRKSSRSASPTPYMENVKISNRSYSPTQGSVYQANSASPRNISPISFASLKETQSQTFSPTPEGDISPDMEVLSTNRLSSAYQRPTSRGSQRKTQQPDVSPSTSPYIYPYNNTQPNVVQPSQQTGHMASTDPNHAHTIQRDTKARSPSPYSVPPPIQVLYNPITGQIYSILPNDISQNPFPDQKRSPSPSISIENKSMYQEQGKRMSRSPVQKGSPSPRQSPPSNQRINTQDGRISPVVDTLNQVNEMYYQKRTTPTAPLIERMEYRSNRSRSVSPVSLEQNRAYSPDTPASPYLQREQYSPNTDPQLQMHHSPELINSPFYRPISPSQLTRHNVSPNEQAGLSQSEGYDRTKTSPGNRHSPAHYQSKDSSGFFQDMDSYSRYPSTLDSKILQSTLNSFVRPTPVYQQPTQTTRTTSTSPMFRQTTPSPVQQGSLDSSQLFIHDLASSQQYISTVQESSIFVPETEEESRIPTPYPYGESPREHTSNFKQNSIGQPIAFSTPTRETKRYKPVSPIQEMREQEHLEEAKYQSSGQYRKTRGESSIVRPNTFKPSHRLLGEIAFQLERRILDFIFAKRSKGQKERLHRRFYGYTVSNIPAMISREATCKDGTIDFKKKVTYKHRYDEIVQSLVPFGYILEKHSYYCLKMINKYGLLSQPPDRQTMEICGLQNPKMLRMFVNDLAQKEKERVHMMILLECLLLLAHEDGQSIFLW